MGAALSSLPWDMDQGQSPLFPSPLPKFCSRLRAQGSPGAQNPLWGWRHHDATHLDMNGCSQAFQAQKLIHLILRKDLGRKGGLGTHLGALGCTGRQGKAMGSLGKGPLGKMGYMSLYGGTQKAVGVLGKGPSWVRGCVLGHPGVRWQVLGCNGMDGNAMGTVGKGASLGKHWGARVFSGVALGCTGVYWGALGCAGVSWPWEGSVWGQQNQVPTRAVFTRSTLSPPCRETMRPHWSL